LDLAKATLETSDEVSAFSLRVFVSASALADDLDTPAQHPGEGVQHFTEEFAPLQQSDDDWVLTAFASPAAIRTGALNNIRIQTIAKIA